MLPWQLRIRQLSCQKTEVCVVNLRVANIGDQRTKGSTEKSELNTAIKITVFTFCFRFYT